MHYSVMLKESIEGLNIKPDGIYVDCTCGYAGHSSEILKRLKSGFLYALVGFIWVALYPASSFTKDSINPDIFKLF